MSSINVISPSLDIETIVDQLIYVERAPVRRLERQTSSMESKIKALQSLNTKLSALLEKLNGALFKDETVPLSVPYGFYQRLAKSVFAARTASSSNEAAVAVTAAKGASTGSYQITVGSLAKAKTSASANFADTDTAATGTGTLVIQTGSGDPVTVTIDEANNTLEGVRDAINNAGAGVNATIISDGSASPYRLLLTAEQTGTVNAFTIADNLTGGQALGLTETQAATDAQLSVNGISITKSTNSISDVISGVTLALKSTTTAAVEIAVGRDTAAVVTAFKDLVAAYNEVNAFANDQSRYNAETQSAGILSGDYTLRMALAKVREILTKPISNGYTGLHYASQVGFRFNSDGSLALDETRLRDALEGDFSSVAGLLLGDGVAGTAENITAGDPRVAYTSKTVATEAGTYAVTVTSLGSQGSVVGGQVIDSLSQAETLTITYGSQVTLVNLVAGDTLATILSRINAAFASGGVSASANNDGTGKIRIATSGYGSSESITVVSSRGNLPHTTGFGTTPRTGTGSNIAGTINGHAAVGAGLTLTGASGYAEDGLRLTIAQTTVGDYGSVTYTAATPGEEGESILVNLRSMLKTVTDPLSGPIHNATDSLNNTIDDIEDRISAYEERLEIRREQLLREFSRADQALRLLTVAQNSLDNQLASLSQVK